jgi:hypothetical protein
MFSVVNAVLQKPLPYPSPERIATLSTYVVGREAGPIRGQIADADFEDWRAQVRSFDAMAYFFARAAAVMVGEQAEYARVGRVSGEFFRVFGVQPTAGRWFDTAEINTGPSTAAIVSAAFRSGRRLARAANVSCARCWSRDWCRGVADDCDRAVGASAGPIVRLGKRAPDQRGHAERIEERAAGQETVRLLCDPVHGEVGPGGRRPRGDRVEWLRSLTDFVPDAIAPFPIPSGS